MDSIVHAFLYSLYVQSTFNDELTHLKLSGGCSVKKFNVLLCKESIHSLKTTIVESNEDDANKGFLQLDKFLYAWLCTPPTHGILIISYWSCVLESIQSCACDLRLVKRCKQRAGVYNYITCLLKNQANRHVNVCARPDLFHQIEISSIVHTISRKPACKNEVSKMIHN